MATPQFTPQTIAPSVSANGSVNVPIPTFNLTGAPVDVSSGYTIAAALQVPAADQNPVLAALDISSAISGAVFTTTGFSFNLSGITLQTIAPTLHGLLSIFISNDSGTTKSLVAQGQTAIVNSGATP